MKIRSKKQFYRLFESGAFGNKAIAWRSFEEFLESGYKGSIGIRYAENVNGLFVPDVPVEDVPKTVLRLVSEGANIDHMKFSEYIPTSRVTMNGEVKDGETGLELTYSTVKDHMRESLRKGEQYARGLTARMLLRQHLWPSSYEDMMAIMDLYPEAVIEFTAYSKKVGSIPGRNAVIWEVRHY